MVTELRTEFRLAAIPESQSIPIAHSRYDLYRQTDKGREMRRKHKTLHRIKEYAERDFVAWDGEGLNEEDGSHSYVLLGNSLGDVLTSREPLATETIFDMMLYHAGDKRIHVIYGGNYDVNMWLKDLPIENLATLYITGHVWWNGYRLSWRGGKSFTIFKNGQRFLIYDVLPFFQSTFVKACDEYLGNDWPNREQIITEKANRGNFSYERIAAITEYNGSELSTLVRLCQELRTRLNKVDIRLNRWDGPGAIATSLYKKYGVKSQMCETPEQVASAARHGYAGGRFEIVRKGHSVSGAFQYDIRSAYPSAMRNLPCLTHGQWTHRIAPTNVVPFGIYRIEVAGTQVSPTRPQPLWHRNSNGTVYFADNPHGWYWSPEAEIGMGLDNAVCYEGWEYHTSCECMPFSFVEGLYNKRAALKKAGDGAHVGLKLGLNSLYGKLAQQIGWDIGPPLRLPPFHCIEWAGYVTSHCRAQVFNAAMLAPDDIIAFETDAVFSRSPLPVDVGTRLGQWDETKYESLTYLKSGMYWGTLSDGREVEKTRGINKGSISRADVIRELRGDQRKLPASQTRFITLGQALSQNFSLWTHWITGPREISTTLWGKRIDVFDSDDNYARTGDGWEETMGALRDEGLSQSYEIAWITGQTDIMDENGIPLEDVRQLVSHMVIEEME